VSRVCSFDCDACCVVDAVQLHASSSSPKVAWSSFAGWFLLSVTAGSVGAEQPGCATTGSCHSASGGISKKNANAA
jgi:hypothetical protein